MTSNKNYKFHHTFTWKIKQFSLYRNIRNEPLKSPLFKTNMSDKIIWYILFYPEGNALEAEMEKGYTSCYLCRDEDCVDETIFCRFSLEIIDKNGKEIFSKESDTEFRSSYYSGWRIFQEIDKLKEECMCFSDNILVIRCRMEGKSSQNATPSENFAETTIGADRIIFNFNVGDSINSSYQNFRFQCPASVKYEMTFHIPQDEVYVTIEKLGNDYGNIKAVLKISLLDVKNAECFSVMYQHVFQESEAPWRVSTLIKRSDIFAKENKFVKEGVATIKCEFCTANWTEVNQTYECRNDQNLISAGQILTFDSDRIDPLVALQQDLRRLYISSKKCDVILRAADITLPAHTVILSARSPVFAALFKSRPHRFVDFPLVEADVLRAFVEYLYTGIVNHMDSETARKLQKIGDKYQVYSLIEECDAFTEKE